MQLKSISAFKWQLSFSYRYRFSHHSTDAYLGLLAELIVSLTIWTSSRILLQIKCFHIHANYHVLKGLKKISLALKGKRQQFQRHLNNNAKIKLINFSLNKFFQVFMAICACEKILGISSIWKTPILCKQ